MSALTYSYRKVLSTAARFNVPIVQMNIKLSGVYMPSQEVIVEEFGI